MWKYLIANAVLFFSTLSVHFFGGRKTQTGFAALLCLGAAAALLTPGVDPFAWLFYVVFAAVLYYGSRQFRRWSLVESVAVDEELVLATRQAETAQAALERKSQETEDVYRRANALAHLYETIHEISKTTDRHEMFVIFGEALTNHFQYSVLTLALYDEENPHAGEPDEIFRLQPVDFSGIFDRGAFLKNKNRLKSRPDAFEIRIFEACFKAGADLSTLEPAADIEDASMRLRPDFKPFTAHPMFMEGKVFAILVLTGITDENFQSLLILIQRFVSEMRRLRLYHKIETLALTDGLTGVSVRRHLLERLESELSRSKKMGFKLSVLMIDIDYFKGFNDQYGHLVGDAVLKQVAETIRKNIREIDLVCRYGGEEFAVLLIETDESAAFFVAERIRHAVQEKIVRAYDENLQATISIGCATLSDVLSGALVLVEAADTALYQAKREGRNRVASFNLSKPSGS